MCKLSAYAVKSVIFTYKLSLTDFSGFTTDENTSTFSGK